MQASAESNPKESNNERDERDIILKRLGLKAWAALIALTAIVVTAVVGGYVPQVIRLLPKIGQPGDPVQVKVISDPAIFEAGDPDWTGYTYVVPIPPDSVPPPPTGLCRDRRAWAYGLDGVDAEFTRIMLELRSHRAETVAINDVRIVVTSAASPMAGTYAECPVGGATGEPVGLLIDLVPQNATWRYAEVPETSKESTRRLPITIKVDEVEYLTVEASPNDGYYEWHLDLLVSDQSGQRWMTVDDKGKPFRTTSTQNAEYRAWVSGSWTTPPR